MSSAYVQDHFVNPRNLGAMADPDAVGLAGVPGQGPFLRIFLRMESGAITDARFETYGCPVARGCGSWLTTWVTGRTPAQAGVMAPADLIRVLGGLPLGKEHCADLAVDALKDALRMFARRQRNALAVAPGSDRQSRRSRGPR